MKGTVIKRGAKWSVVLDLGRDENGKRIRRWHSGFRTKKDAEVARIELLAKVQQGSYVQPARTTVADYLLGQWLPAIGASVRTSTLSSYRMIVVHHIVPALGGVTLQNLTPARLNAFYADLLSHGRKDGKGLSHKSVRNIHVVLRKALGDAMKWGTLARNPAALSEPPKLRNAGRAEMRTWAPEEARAFLTDRESDRLYTAWLLLASTGMRRGEVLGLRWRDIDFDGATLSVRQTLITVDYGLEFSTPKTQKSRRSISLDVVTVAALRTHRAAQLQERMMVGAAYTDHDLVFSKPDGSPLHPDYVSQLFDRAVSRLGLPRIRLHDLRHTYATLALQAGVHPKIVSERLGHSTVAFTLDVYSHALPTMQAEAAEIVAGLILGS